MAVTTVASGTQAATIGTEHNLSTAITTEGAYVLVVDTNAMVGGDRLVLRVKKKAASSGTQRLARIASYRNLQSLPIKDSVPIPVSDSLDLQFTLQQTAGTGRSFLWAILKL